MTCESNEIWNAAIEEAAHVCDIENLRLHSLAYVSTGDRQKQLETDARYVGLLATLIRERKKA